MTTDTENKKCAICENEFDEEEMISQELELGLKSGDKIEKTRHFCGKCFDENFEQIMNLKI